MKKITFRIFVALITFIIGWFIASLFTFYPVEPVCSGYSVVSENSYETSENEEYAVYSAILAQNKYNAEKMVVSEYKIQKISDLSQEIIEDYPVKNIKNRELKNNFTVSGKVIFISEKEVTQIFSKGDSWSEFYKSYPNSSGIISFSDVGFNQERTKALVYVTITCGGLSGDGSFIFLEKINGNWIIKGNRNLWVS